MKNEVDGLLLGLSLIVGVFVFSFLQLAERLLGLNASGDGFVDLILFIAKACITLVSIIIELYILKRHMSKK